jgi:hypothetical protein
MKSEKSEREVAHMTPDEQHEEGTGEPVEDLEAPAEAQDDVAGGACAKPTTFCVEPSCVDTIRNCIRLTLQQVEHLQ